jgi:hypothetical protein
LYFGILNKFKNEGTNLLIFFIILLILLFFFAFSFDLLLAFSFDLLLAFSFDLLLAFSFGFLGRGGDRFRLIDILSWRRGLGEFHFGNNNPAVIDSNLFQF